MCGHASSKKRSLPSAQHLEFERNRESETVLAMCCQASNIRSSDAKQKKCLQSGALPNVQHLKSETALAASCRQRSLLLAERRASLVASCRAKNIRTSTRNREADKRDDRCRAHSVPNVLRVECRGMQREHRKIVANEAIGGECSATARKWLRTKPLLQIGNSANGLHAEVDAGKGVRRRKQRERSTCRNGCLQVRQTAKACAAYQRKK